MKCWICNASALYCREAGVGEDGNSALVAKPEYEVVAGPAATDGDKILPLARDWPRGRAYEGLLEAAVAGCQ